MILAGGRGERLGELTRHTPKPLLQIRGRPVLEHLIWNLARHGIRRLILCVSYLAEEIVRWCGDGRRFGASVEYVVEQSPAGTGGALKLAGDRLDDVFLLLNGDTLFDVNYLDLATFARQRDALAAMAVARVENREQFGGVDMEGEHVVRFAGKGVRGPGLVNGGVYVLRREIISWVRSVPTSLEEDVLPGLMRDGQLLGRVYERPFLDIGTPESLATAQTAVEKWRRRPAAFLDRDGVLNVDRGYVHRVEDFEWIEGAPQAVKWLNDRGYLVFVVSNQAGIARGYYEEADALRLFDWMQADLRKVGAHIDAFYFCPHHPFEGRDPYRMNCACRKPKPGLLLRAMGEWEVDVERSFFIDDRAENLQAATMLGIRSYHFQGGSLLAVVQDCSLDSSKERDHSRVGCADHPIVERE